MNPIVTLLRRTLAGAALVGLAIGAAPNANAAFITVTAADDVRDNANGDCTLREAVAAANTNAAVDGCVAGSGDDTIIFAQALGSFTLNIQGSITASENVSIEGQNGASNLITVDAAGQGRMFIADFGTRLSISNMTLMNGEDNYGGAIFYRTGSSGALADVTFMSNLARINGGAVYNQGTITVTGCTFTSNAALGDTPRDGGGAIFNSGVLTVSAGSTFSNNTATTGLGNGGAIFNRRGMTADVTDSGGAVTFTGNRAARAGGAIESAGPLTLTNVTFNANQANINGGALHMSERAQTTSTGGTVTGNVALKEGGGYWNSAAGTLTVNGTNFSNNTAGGDDADQGGGGIFSDGGATSVTGGAFNNNTATGASGSGGAIQTIQGATLTVTGSTFTGNTSNRAGGGIEVAGGSATITNATFTGNITDRAPGNGGGVHIGGAAQLTVDASTFTGNQATEGGGLWISGGTTAFVTNGTSFTANSARGDASSQGGGGFYSDGGDAFLTNASFTGNSATGIEGSGGGVNIQGGSFVFEGGSVNDNTANRAGGGIEVAGGITVIEDVMVSGNNAGVTDAGDDSAAAPGYGAGVHAGGSSNVTVILSTFVGNRAVQGGGLWNGGFSEMNVRETTISSNRAVSGAGLYQAGGLNGTGKLTVRRSLIAINNASMMGGGIGARKADVLVFNSSISGNLAVNGGGFGSIGANVEMLNVTLANNSASSAGGGAWNSDPEADGGLVELSNTIVADNAAPTAGDLFGAYASAGWNLVETTTSAALTDDATNIIGQDPLLGPPADNGGPTFTHALLAGSPAIDAGQSSVAVDQRGYVRPVLRDDIGAFEVGAVPPGDIIVANEEIGEDGVLLSAASPNPIAANSTLKLAVSQPEAVRAVLYDALGRQVATLFDGPVQANTQVSIEIDASGLSSGVYIVRVTGQTFARSQQVTVVR